MNRKTIKQILATVVFIVFLPLIAIELMIKSQGHFFARIKLSYQLMLFIIDFGSQKNGAEKIVFQISKS